LETVQDGVAVVVAADPSCDCLSDVIFLRRVPYRHWYCCRWTPVAA
jgi:hypothetical protein